MKKLKLSDTKYDDLRRWVEDVIRRGFSLSSMPTSRALKAKVNKEMIPPNMQSSDTGAKFELQAALFHAGEHFLERPDIKMHLRAGDTLIHLAKIGSDFLTGLGKMSQKKESEFDEDGTHNTGFQTLKFSRGDQTRHFSPTRRLEDQNCFASFPRRPKKTPLIRSSGRWRRLTPSARIGWCKKLM